MTYVPLIPTFAMVALLWFLPNESSPAPLRMESSKQHGAVDDATVSSEPGDEEDACSHCSRGQVSFSGWKGYGYGKTIDVCFTLLGGQDGQCQSNGCDHLQCVWRGTITVTNKTGQTLNEVRIEVGPVEKKKCTNVANGSTCQWDFSTPSKQHTENCSSTKDNKSQIKIVILDDRGNAEKTAEFNCNKCPIPLPQ